MAAVAIFLAVVRHAASGDAWLSSTRAPRMTP